MNQYLAPVFRPLLLVALLAALLAGCSGVPPRLEKPALTVTNIRFLDAGLFEQRYRMTLRVKNPNAVGLPVTGVRYELLFQGEPFADGLSNQQFVVPAYGDATFDVDLTTNILKTARHIAGLIRDKQGELGYEMRGHVVVDMPFVGRVPFSEQGTIRLN